MTKQEIISALVEKHKTFAAFFDTLDKDQFENSVSNKWSPGEQLEHILLSVKPLEKGLSSAPKLVLKLSFGTSKNGSRSYQEVIDLYHDKLSKGAKATKKFIPKTIVEAPSLFE